EDEEVLEPPEQDRGQRQPGQVGRVELEALALEAELASGPQHAAQGGAVPADAALLPELLQGHEPAVAAEDDPQRGRPALHRLHLDHGRGALAPPGRDVRTRRARRLLAAHEATSLALGV